MYKKSIFIFRRDLRAIDNTALDKAINESNKVLLIFIFDPRQAKKSNPYYSKNAIEFMLNSISDLKSEIENKNGKIHFFIGDPSKILAKMISNNQIDAIFCNRDYTPFSIDRDLQINEICKKNNIYFNQYHDYLLTNPYEVKTNSNTNYKVFSAFYKKAQQSIVREPIETTTFDKKIIKTKQENSVTLKSAYQAILNNKFNTQIGAKGGRKSAIKILSKLDDFKSYNKNKDYPALNNTRLSAHLKFGTVSIREVFYKIYTTLGDDHPLIRQLYWRDFFTYITLHYPYVFGKPFYKKYSYLKWSNNEKLFNAWCEGKTGFPIVDAGMRELNETGFMHNRTRMITASFLVKDLHIDWQWGEKYFANKLVDYDPAVNNGNWQWAASTGCDSQPYFRIFNPWSQQKKLDPECVYIKKWIPEIKNLTPKIIHNWYTNHPDFSIYIKPIVDHSIEAKKAISLYRSL